MKSVVERGANLAYAGIDVGHGLYILAQRNTAARVGTLAVVPGHRASPDNGIVNHLR